MPSEMGHVDLNEGRGLRVVDLPCNHPFGVYDKDGEPADAIGCWGFDTARSLCSRLNAAESGVTGRHGRWEVVNNG